MSVFDGFITGGGSGSSSVGIGGSTGATDDAILIADGVGGATLAASAATLTAAGSLTIPNSQVITVGKTNGTRGLVFGGSTSSDAGFGYTAAAPGINVLLGDGSDWTDLTLSRVFFQNSNNFIATSSNRLNLSANSGVYLTNEAGSEMRWVHAAVEVEANTAGSGSPNVLTIAESVKVLTNEGATAKNYHTLPTAVAGYQFTFICQDADGIRITANTGDTIRVIDKETAAGGYIESTTIGSTVTLVSVNAVEWYATSISGVFTDGTFTYDNTSLTTP